MDRAMFKAYDIRALSPEVLDEDAAFRIGQAYAKFTGAKRVAVGKDMRGTTPALFAALAKGLNSQGCDVVDIGLITTPMLYFAVGQFEEFDGGLMVTASHNPSEYNGIKMCYGDALPIGAESGMEDIRDLAMAGPYGTTGEGSLETRDIVDAYLDRLFSGVDTASIAPQKVVIDIANGMEGAIIDRILERLPQIDATVLFKELDGTFPNHEANPLKEETLDALKAKMKEIGADVGVAFDGDGDRVGLVDETGRMVRGDVIVAMLAPTVLASAPGAAVLYDVRESMMVPEEIAKAGGRPVMTRVGHGLIKPHMRREDAVFAGELSNHFYFREFYGAESSDLVMLLALQLAGRAGSLSALVDPLMRYAHSGEINSKVADKDAVFAGLRAAYAPSASEVIEIDGLRMEFRDASAPEDDWWFSVRASNTEPVLRLNLEAKSAELMEAKKAELLGIIRG
jgi:phosphomannomutase